MMFTLFLLHSLLFANKPAKAPDPDAARLQRLIQKPPAPAKSQNGIQLQGTCTDEFGRSLRAADNGYDRCMSNLSNSAREQRTNTLEPLQHPGVGVDIKLK